MKLKDLVLMPEVDARRALAGKDIVFLLLAPVGTYVGRGVLRVLRVNPSTSSGVNAKKERVELVCGYERYDRLDSLDGPSTRLRMTKSPSTSSG